MILSLNSYIPKGHDSPKTSFLLPFRNPTCTSTCQPSCFNCLAGQPVFRSYNWHHATNLTRFEETNLWIKLHTQNDDIGCSLYKLWCLTKMDSKFKDIILGSEVQSRHALSHTEEIHVDWKYTWNLRDSLQTWLFICWRWSKTHTEWWILWPDCYLRLP